MFLVQHIPFGKKVGKKETFIVKYACGFSCDLAATLPLEADFYGEKTGGLLNKY